MNGEIRLQRALRKRQTVDGDLIKKTAQAIREAKKGIAFTGAGISVESGIPDFRGPSGLWEKFDPMEYATIEAFCSNPQKVWTMIKEMGSLLEKSRPNPAHLALAELEQMGFLSSIVTQNIDDLHQAAGSKKVIEFHGSGKRFTCMNCGKACDRREVKLDFLPPRCFCGGVLKPDIVFFGEPIPWKAHTEAQNEAGSCDLMLVIGTSAVVSPACDLPVIAKRRGAKVVEINLEETQLTGKISNWMIKGSASRILQKILHEVLSA